MDTKKKNAAAEPQAAAAKKNRSIDSFRQGDIWCNIFAFDNKAGSYHRFTISRSYRDKTGNWQRTQFFGPEDADSMAAAVMNAVDRIHALEKPE